MAIGKLDAAETEVNQALRLHPAYREAKLLLAELSVKRNRPEEAVSRLEVLIRDDSTYPEAFRMLAQIYQTFHLDSVKGRTYLEQYDRLRNVANP